MAKLEEKQPLGRDPTDKEVAVFDHLKKEPLAAHTTDGRLWRMAEVVTQRLQSVTVVMENLHDAHNVGAVVRTAECYGIDTLHVVEMPNPYSPNKGIARGADKWINVERHRGLNRVIGDLVADGFTICAADVGEGCVPMSELPIDKPIAILMGSERDGVSDRAKKLVDVRFSIPMMGFTESFNVSVSAAVVLHEITQRRRKFLGEPGDMPLEKCQTRAAGWLPKAIRRSVQRLMGQGGDVVNAGVRSIKPGVLPTEEKIENP